MFISTATSASSFVLLDTVLVFDGVREISLLELLEDFRGEAVDFLVMSVILALESVRLFSLSIDFFGDGAFCFAFFEMPNASLLNLFLSSKP